MENEINQFEDTPLISVVMSVFNGESYLGLSIESILKQTFKNFEFIIVNDGSTDKSEEIIEKYASQDRRIKILNKENSGLTDSLNKGIQLSKGVYVARQDADDISLPGRFSSQLNWFSQGANRVLCGTYARIIDDQEKIIGTIRYPTDHQRLSKRLLYTNVFIHSSAMFLKETFEIVGRYRPFFTFSQDYDLWCRLSLQGCIGNLNDHLILFRHHDTSISAKKKYSQIQYAALAATDYSHNIKNGFDLNFSKTGSIQDAINLISNKQARTHFNLVVFANCRNESNLKKTTSQIGICAKLAFLIQHGLLGKYLIFQIMGHNNYNKIKQSISKFGSFLFSSFC
jgi:glycosyltransferase involved in cell wall biosynthesis